MVQTIGVVSAHIVSLSLESLLYGVFALFFCIILSIAFGPKHSRFSNRRRILQISGLMMVLSTSHLVLSLIRMVQVFDGVPRTSVESDPTARLADPLDHLVVARTSINMAETILGDAILVWRCFVIYNKTLWIVAPGLLILALDIAVFVRYRVLAGVHSTDALYGPGVGWSLAFVCSSIVLHAGYTGIIVRKIYCTRRNIQASPSLMPVIASLLESGAIYSVAVVILLACIVTGTNGLYVIMDVIPHIVGIVFCLAILQIHVYMKDKDIEVHGGASINMSIPWRREPRATETLEIRISRAETSCTGSDTG